MLKKWLWGLLLCFCSLPVLALQNQLANHPSPYLAMHGNDPVHWQAWNAQTLELAKKEDKLLFISSGYFACHWCHVMQRESYQDAVIAELLNTWFIPVKIDRELNPALDEHLIDFVRRTQGHAGWPLNVFLTPEGYPVAGIIYVPAEQFRVLLGRMQKMWQAEKAQVTGLARQAMKELVRQRQSSGNPGGPLPGKELLQKFLGSAMGMADEMAGGFGQQNRFPMTPQLSAMLEIQARDPDESLADFLRLTLDYMARKGLRDHLAGGFFRYTVDPDWQTPHYEKMLYTQALLAGLYLRAAEVFKEPAYAEVARNTLAFAVREMCNGDACVASFSAVDDEGVEGAYYLWKEAELKQLLKGELWELARKYWQLQGFESRPGGVLPMRGDSVEELAKSRNRPVAQIRKQLEQAQQLLLAARSKRSLPVDDKRLAGWNGLMLSALSKAARQLDAPEFLGPAKKLRNYLVKQLWNGKQLYRAVHQGQPVGQASLADYAYVARGLKRWAEVSGNKNDGRLADELLTVAWRDFYTDHGWLSSSRALLPGMPSVQTQEDGALPAAAAIVMRLSLASGNAQLRSKAQKLIPATWLAVQGKPFWYASSVEVLLSSPTAANPP
ncbi:thioredoxin domain-containing protein [Thiolapillus sp.]